MRVEWLNRKGIDFKQFQINLEDSLSSNQMTNYGPVVQKLEKFFHKLLKIEEDQCLIVVDNATSALHALVAGINIKKNKTLHYATQAFTFPSSCQGPLQDTIIVDIDEEMGIDLDQVPTTVDGIIVTNLFGHVVDIEKYVAWAERNGKILLFDNATVPMTFYKGKNAVCYGDGCIISLHHTKPFGFGEGGIIVTRKKYETIIRRCINFGFNVSQGKICWSRQGSNYKMSDLSAAGILTYLTLNYKKIVHHHQKIYKFFLKRLREIPNVTLVPNFSEDTPMVSCIPVIFEKEITTAHLYQLELSKITARKYYNPLEPLPKSIDIYKRILCFPCHLQVTYETINRYIEFISQIAKEQA